VKRVHFLLLPFLLILIGGWAGCAKKQVKPSSGMPFELDSVFGGVRAISQSWKDKGIRAAGEKKYEEAIDAFTKHVEEHPESFFGFNALAVCHKNLGNQADAMLNFERALEFADTPNDQAKILSNIGNLYFAADKPQVALGYYKEAAAQHEQNPLYFVLIARTFITLGDFERARRVLNDVEARLRELDQSEKEEDRGLGRYLLAHCWAALNEEEKTLEHLSHAVRRNPERFIPRFERESKDPKHIFYSLQGDRRISDMFRKFGAPRKRVIE
jgi:tetratricopeptide (TPR) repeat protein